MRFKVELLSGHADPASVVQVSYGRTIEHAKAEARTLQLDADDVNGFQIRDLDHTGHIVWTEKRYR